MRLQLTRPLAIFDLETTGTSIAKDRIVEIAIVKLFPDGSEEEFCKRVNPEMEIPLEASKVHGIYNKDVALEPTFEVLAEEVLAFIEGCDLGGFNSNRFDVPILAEEMLRVGKELVLDDRKLVDAQVIFHKMEERTLTAAYKFYCDGDLTDAHSALADTKATLNVLKAQVEKYDALQPNVDFLSGISYGKKTLDYAGRLAINDEGEPVFNFGKHKNKRIADVLAQEPGYYGWMLNADFPLDTKNQLKKVKEELAK